MGIAQFMPATARSWNVNPCDPHSAIDGQARMMAALLVKFDGRKDLALAAYNSGPNRVARLGRVPRIRETMNYVAFITQREKEWKP
jgi:soluble lytic murein transglycosylase-like protein